MLKPEAPLNQSLRPALELDELDVLLGERRLRLDRRCVLQAGRLYLMVGPSGSGKSSFARAHAGLWRIVRPATPCHGEVAITDDAGGRHVHLEGRRLRSGRAGRRSRYCPRLKNLASSTPCRCPDNLVLFSRLGYATDATAEIDRLAAQFRLSPLPAPIWPARRAASEFACRPFAGWCLGSRAADARGHHRRRADVRASIGFRPRRWPARCSSWPRGGHSRGDRDHARARVVRRWDRLGRGGRRRTCIRIVECPLGHDRGSEEPPVTGRDIAVAAGATD